MDPQLKLALTIVAGLLADWEEQSGEGVCDCRPEPYNEGHVCNACKARDLLLDAAERVFTRDLLWVAQCVPYERQRRPAHGFDQIRVGFLDGRHARRLPDQARQFALRGDEPPDLRVRQVDRFEPRARYVAEICRDGPEAGWKTRPYDLVVERRTVTTKDTLDLRLAASGGAAIRIRATH